MSRDSAESNRASVEDYSRAIYSRPDDQAKEADSYEIWFGI
jgi:hypothetical protein